MFDYFKKIAISNRADDELLYEYVLNEMESDIIIKGLWGKALANSNGNEANAKSIYMKYRVQSIKDIFTAREIAYSELTKPKLFQYIQDKIIPISSDYVNLPNAQSESKIADNYKVSEYEESIYNKVAEELSNEIRKEGLWLKAIQNTDGDESRALSLYIKYRSESIKSEMKQLESQAKLEKKLLAEQKEQKKSNDIKRLEEEKKVLKKKRNEKWLAKGIALSSNDKFGLLQEFIEKKGMKITERISDEEAIVYSSNNIDINIEFIAGAWELKDI